MKTYRLLFITLIFILGGSVLSACAGRAAATSWPGLTIDQDTKTGYLAYNQQVYAINLSNGTEKWRFPAKASGKETFFAPPTLTGNGQLLVGSYDNLLYNLNADNGQAVQGGHWPFQGGNSRYIASALVLGDHIYAPNADGSLYALDSAGNELWRYKTKQPLWATPASDGKTLFQPSMDHHIYALDAQTGKLIWETDDLGGALVGTPTIGKNGELYEGSFGHEMLAIDSGTGKTIWKTATEGWVWAGPDLEGDTLYFGDLKGFFYALNAADGSVRWKIQPETESTYSISDKPLVMKDKIYYTAENGNLYAVEAATGKSLWSKALGGKLYGAPQLTDDTLLVAPLGANALLVDVDLNGNQKWAFTPEKK